MPAKTANAASRATDMDKVLELVATWMTEPAAEQREAYRDLEDALRHSPIAIGTSFATDDRRPG